MVTNLTNLTTTKNFAGIIEYANNVTNGILGWSFMVFLMVMLTLMFLRRNTFEESILGASFICFAFSIFFDIIGLVTSSIPITFGVILAFSGFWVYLSKK